MLKIVSVLCNELYRISIPINRSMEGQVGTPATLVGTPWPRVGTTYLPPEFAPIADYGSYALHPPSALPLAIRRQIEH